MEPTTGQIRAAGPKPANIREKESISPPFVRKWHPIPEIQFYAITGEEPDAIAWLAYFLSYQNASLCVHEPWTRRINPGAFQGLYHYLGVAESHLQDIDRQFLKKSRAVFILDRFEEPSYTLEREMDHHPQKLVLVSTHVKSSEGCQTIWDFCLPGVPFPVDWWKECKHKRIEMHPQADYSCDYTEQLKRTVRTVLS